MLIETKKLVLVISRRMLLLRVGRWTLYFPSSFSFGHKYWRGHFSNWSFCYVTLERKLR